MSSTIVSCTGDNDPNLNDINLTIKGFDFLDNELNDSEVSHIYFSSIFSSIFCGLYSSIPSQIIVLLTDNF